MRTIRPRPATPAACAATAPTRAKTILAMAAMILTTAAPAPAGAAGDVATANAALATAAFDPDLATITPAQAREELALLKAALTVHHPGYDRFATEAELDAWWGGAERAAASGPTAAAWYTTISRLLAMIRCDHTKAELPEAMVAFRTKTPRYLPVRLAFFGDRAYVAAVADGVDGVAVGDELIAVGDLSTRAIVERAAPMLSVDGFTDAAKDLELGYSSEYEGAAFDLFNQLMFGGAAAYQVVTLNADGVRTTQTVDALTYPDWVAMATDGGSRYVNFADEVSWRNPAPGVAALRVGTFVNYRKPVDAAALYDGVFRAIAASGAERLIVDLRDCGGGSDDAALGLLRHLMVEPFVWAKPARVKAVSFDPALREHLSTWDQAVFNADPAWFERQPDGMYEMRMMQDRPPIEPAAAAFPGEVVVLTSAANASGATHVIAKLKDAGRVTLVGESTGGNPRGCTAGIIVFLNLPHSGVTVRVPLQRTVLNVTSFEDGVAIDPDVRVARTPETYFSAADETLEAAIALPRE